MSNDLIRKPQQQQGGYPPAGQSYTQPVEDFDLQNTAPVPQGVPPIGYGYMMGTHLNQDYIPQNTQNRVKPQQAQHQAPANNMQPGGFGTYPIFKETPCKPSPPANGDIRESDYEKFINWVVNAHIGKTWVLLDFILTDGRKIQGSIMNLINLSYRSNPKPSEMGIEIILKDKLFNGFVCIPLNNLQIDKTTVSNSQHQW